MTRSTSKRPSQPPSASSAPPKRSSKGSTLPWGFKSKAERRALEVRAELKLGACDCLQPRILAKHLGLRVVLLRELVGFGLSGDGLAHLTGRRRGVFSGAYCAAPDCPAYILLNESHATTRQASDIVHECAHHLLSHELTEPFDELGLRYWNKAQEEQAEWLAGPLLVPRDGARWAINQGMDSSQAASHFGVSVIFFDMRANVTGARLQARRAARL